MPLSEASNPGPRSIILALYGDPDLLAASNAKVQAPIEAKIKTLLGADKYEVFHFYENRIMLEFLIVEVNDRLPSNQKLSPDQKEKLLASLSTANPNVHISTDITPTVLVEANEYLNATQYDSLLTSFRIQQLRNSAVEAKRQQLESAGWQGNPAPSKISIPAEPNANGGDPFTDVT